MRQPEDGAGADERLGEALPIEGAPAVWHDEPPPDDYHVEVADVDLPDGETPEASAPLFADPVTLRPARRTGGIRAPRPYVAPTPIVAPPVTDTDRGDPFADVDARPMGRPTYGTGRPLPRVGTEALGRCARLARFGAFIDFSGHRGLIHISQLRPGIRVERVEDVIAIGDEVVVRVIAVDPQSRHLNLAYVGPAPYAPSVDARPMATTLRDEPDRAAVVPSSTPTPADAADSRGLTPAHATFAPHPPTPAGAADARGLTPAHATLESHPPTPVNMGVPEPITPAMPAPTPVDVAIPIPTRAADVPHIPARAVESAATSGRTPLAEPPSTRASVAQPTPARAVPVPPTPPVAPRRREIVGYVPGARVRTETPTASTPTAGGVRPASRPAAPPKPPEVARTGSRAMRRELDDPNHPMARFLAMSPDLGAAPRAARPAARPPVPPEPIDPEPEIAPEPPRMVPATRLVHADEPEPELPMSDTPATIEALAARFGTKPSPATRETRPAPSSRSQAAREAQARMLEQLRRQG